MIPDALGQLTVAALWRVLIRYGSCTSAWDFAQVQLASNIADAFRPAGIRGR